MEVIRSIKRNAADAAARQRFDGTPPENPCAPETDEHKEWARAYYEADLALEAADTVTA